VAHQNCRLGLAELYDMASIRDRGVVVVTGADGHIGREVCRLLRTSGTEFLPVDLDPGETSDFLVCDLRKKNDVARLFRSQPVRAVIHLAAILPSAFHSNPLAAVDLNLTGCFELLRQAVSAHVQRFVFASSRSVYGSSFTGRPLTEGDPAIPDEPYGASKRVVELVGETLATANAIEFVSLRIAIVIGPGIKKTSSPWRSEIFQPSSKQRRINIPFAPEAVLPLVHVEDVARMLVTLAETSKPRSLVYNTPVENWEAGSLKEMIEQTGAVRVDPSPRGPHGGPLCDGSRFAAEFGFQLRGLRERLLGGQD
jgi:nucleoside-diphosphate-sugar epimerase